MYIKKIIINLKVNQVYFDALHTCKKELERGGKDGQTFQCSRLGSDDKSSDNMK